MANIKSFPNNQDVYIGAEDVMKWLHGRTSGVFAAGSNLAVAALASPVMKVTVTDGTGWMTNNNGDGVVVWNDNNALTGNLLQLDIDSADGVLDRIDRIIIEWQTTNYVAYPEIKVLKGTASSTATAPALTNSSIIRQISLARIKVDAGTTSIAPSMITDERLDPSVCGLVTDGISIDTSTINAQFQAFLAAIERELADIEGGSAYEMKKIQIFDVDVSKNAFEADSTYDDYPYRASVGYIGVISSMIPEVVFSLTDAISGMYAPIAEAYNGGVYIYASAVPEDDITIPTIICWKGN